MILLCTNHRCTSQQHPPHPRLMLLCGTQNGALQLVEVPADSCFVESLDCDGDVTHVLADEHSHKVFVATTRTNHKHSPSTPAAMSVEALDPYTGDAHVVLRLGRDETVTAFCKWELDEVWWTCVKSRFCEMLTMYVPCMLQNVCSPHRARCMPWWLAHRA